MKKFLHYGTMSWLLVALLFGSGAFGADLTPKQRPKSSPPQPAEMQAAPEPPTTETETLRGQAPGLVPKHQDYSVVHNPAPQPESAFGAQRLAAQTVIVTDSTMQAELDRLSEEVKALKKDVQKPDTKKAWAAPKISGRLFLDSVNFMDRDDLSKARPTMKNATGFRELRLGASGSGYDSFDYKIELGFHPDAGRVALVDNWIGAKNVPLLGYVRAGHFKPETGLYYPMGSTNISLMEYTTPSNIFGLGRKVGISSEHLFASDRIRLFFGVFQGATTDLDRYARRDNQGEIVNLRLTAAPWFAQEGKYVLHLGGHWEYVSTQAKTATLETTPGTFAFGIAKALQAEGFASDHSNRGGLEFAYQHGPFSARSEVFAGSFDGGEHLYGAYVELAYFLTDDYRSYDLKSGAFGAPKIKRNFHPYKHGDWNLVDSLGAWQVVFQWGYTDMSDWRRTYDLAGHQNDLILGLNWFWTPQLRWVFEYVHSEQCVGSTHSRRSQDIFGTSIRVNF